MVKNMVANIRRSPTVVLAAYDLTPGTVSKLFATNVNVSVFNEPPGTSIKDVEAATLGQLEASNVLLGTPRSSLVDLPAGQAYKIVCHLRLKITTDTVQYGFVHNGLLYAVSYTTTRSAGSAYVPVFTRSIGTFRFND